MHINIVLSLKKHADNICTKSSKANGLLSKFHNFVTKMKTRFIPKFLMIVWFGSIQHSVNINRQIKL